MSDQTDTNLLELERSAREKRPVFAVMSRFTPGIEGSKDACLLTFVLERNDIHYLKTEVFHDNEITTDIFTFPVSLPDDGTGLIEGSMLKIKYEFDRGKISRLIQTGYSEDSFDFSIVFSYGDILSYEHKQQILVKYNLPPIAKPPFMPELYNKMFRMKINRWSKLKF